MDLSVRRIARECLNLSGTVSVRRNVFIRDPEPPNSLRAELEFIRRTRCKPDAPTNLRVRQVGEGRIDLAWTDNADNEDGFRVRFRGKKTGFGDDERTKTFEDANRTSASITDLRNGFEYTISVLAFNRAGESPFTNEVQATTPTVEEKRTVDLTRQDTVEGFIPYLGKFPEGGVVPKGRLLRIRVPQIGSSDLAVAFVKRDSTTANCGNPGAVVVLGEGQTSSSEQMRDIFGESELEFTIQNPIFFVACISTPGPPPNFVPIEITVIFD
jgi:hypothetical protein